MTISEDRPALLTENHTSKMELVERIVEGKKSIIARGTFAKCDVPTQNGRIYSRKLYEREVSRLQEAIRRKRALGELDHPADGATKLQRASHLITALDIKPDGTVVGEAKILGTPNGQILKSLIEGGVEVGVSSRGVGSTSRVDGTNEMVNDDFQLKTFDFVYEPAADGAYPEVYTEAVEDFDWSADVIREEFPQFVSELLSESKTPSEPEIKGEDADFEAALNEREEALRQEMTDKVERMVAEGLKDAREKAASQLAQEMKEDAEDSKAKAVLEHLASILMPYLNEGDGTDMVAVKDALTAKDREINKAKAEADELYAHSVELTNLLMVERMIGGRPDADQLREFFPDVRNADPKELQEAVEEILLDFPIQESIEPAVAPVEDGRIAQLEADLAQLEEEKRSLKNRLHEATVSARQAERKAKEAVEMAHDHIDQIEEETEALIEDAERRVREAELSAYKAERAKGHVNSRELNRLTEGARSEGEVDTIIEEHGRSRMSDSELERLRRRAQKGLRPRSRHLNESEAQERRPSGHNNFDEQEISLLGRSLSDLRVLSGIDPAPEG